MKEQNRKEPADPKKAARRAKLKKLFTILKFVTLILIIAAVPVYILVFHQDWIAQMQDLDQVRRAIADYNGLEAPFIYIGAQIIQIIISVIPGQALQIAAGFMFGFPVALGLSVIGAALGTVITYYLGKVLGRDAMHLLFPRYYRMEDGNGETIVKASAIWALMDCETRRVVFPEEYGVGITGERTGAEPALPSAPKPPAYGRRTRKGT